MKYKRIVILLLLLYAGISTLQAQSDNVNSLFEGERILSVRFDYTNPPTDSARLMTRMRQVEDAFLIYPYSHYSGTMAAYYLTRVRNLPFVENATLDISPSGEGGIYLLLNVHFSQETAQTPKTTDIFRNIRSFPVIYSRRTNFLTFRASASEMVYSDNNAWFARPGPLLQDNPLVHNPAGPGYTGWIEGYAMGGIYGIAALVPRWNLHIYGGANYVVSFSAGQELFTDRGRFYGKADDAYIGIVGGKHIGDNRGYSYNLLFGRKQFVLGNGWLIINTAMNGEERGALQLNPRRAAKSLLQAGGRWNKWLFQFFRLKPDELPLLDSHTLLNGLNIELGNSDRIQAAATLIHSPHSRVRYYFPDGAVQTRKGLWVYNLRLFGNPPDGQPGLFYKSEFGYQTNSNFPMKAYAWYVRLGWNFAHTAGKPALSYRFAYFSGDNPDTYTYERWDALYTGGTGEQWVQGSNMYKIVQNSNEMTHLLQLVYTPVPKLQTITQFWSFLAPRLNNIGGNPGLSILKSHYYGTELNLTIKYFHSRHWYFHLNTALTFPGNAIRDMVPGSKHWFCLMAFVQYML